ncbi:uncharacterized protein ATNIH1004_009448 [Aspergillus tanneri]|uniref:Uncharacterized protein n=1 Tax=Aspergillus tanneri TaxID=1220188 RepID=A0A5M9MAJ8_9EURO|nr:uncharacterized protein ATNIH1004_009448 [Aspergillus tanneri]KAA8642696.1 hypothetical protein ATNIH1004_009448 [Aspergillus tanneri]
MRRGSLYLEAAPPLAPGPFNFSSWLADGIARPTVRASWLMVLTMFGGCVALDGEYACEASAADRALSATIFAATQTWLDNGRIKSHPIRVLDDSCAGVIQGVDIIRTGAISGQKLVVRVD